ncbi:hypothetical protein KCMC57_up26800 [Kitasatospora sp. CMC57]|uniref:Uncharacterized protein n=1 Tax=Kitasatospora sp. CMC57 TaxID=3231513 RepID=A0AB33K0M2_9ACTN
MADAQTLLAAVDRLADRFRSMPQSRLLGPVDGHPSRAAAVHALAARLAVGALESAGEPAREFPDAGPFAVGDQLAVAGRELAAVAGPAELDAAVAEVRTVDRLTA